MALPRIDVGLARDERLPAVLLLIFFFMLCFAGGASREDVLAQTVIRAVAILLMIIQIVFGRSPDLKRYKACAILLASMIVLAAVQLIPLPPAIWTALPGRAIITASPVGAQGWRPLNIVPDAGWNALFSLLIPLCTLVLLASLRVGTTWRAQYLIVGAAMFSAFLALLQAAGSVPENPLINGSTTDYAGIFANRNHQALFLAIGILLCWFWGSRGGGTWRDRRLWLAFCIVLLLLVSILVTGSRAGVLLGGLAVIAGPVVVLSRQTRRSRRKLDLIIWSAISLAMVGGVVVLSAYSGRAFSLDRAMSLTLDNDFRLRSFATIRDVAMTYFPFGAGLGTFDTTFRIAEPFALLEPTYLNHAHNDFLETVIETGIFGPAILLCVFVWAIGRILATRSSGWENARIARMGVLVFGMVIIASISDYPARTPMIMVVLTLAAVWLTGAPRESGRMTAGDALPIHPNSL